MLNKQLICEYPIPFLQEKLHGIMTGDMIMFALASGRGKSTISRLIINYANEQNAPAVLFSLEDEPQTFHTDMVYKQYLKNTKAPMDFREWMLDISLNPDKYKAEAREAAKRTMAKNKEGVRLQQVFEMKIPNWTVEEISKKIEDLAKQGYKLFVLDHMDVLVPSESPADMVRAINTLWQLVAEKQIALITFSQLSTVRNKESLCPSIDDLRGSKSKVHTPTIVVSLAHSKYPIYPEYEGYPTYCRILKNRQGGKTGCSVVFFHNGEYTKNFVEVDCNESGTVIDGMSAKDLDKKSHQFDV